MVSVVIRGFVADGSRPESWAKEKANLISKTGLYLCRQRPESTVSWPKDSQTLGVLSALRGLT
jgi:hypothetical protein